VPSATLDEALARHAFLEWDPLARTLRGSPGRWDVEGSLTLPEGVGLARPAGTTLRFGRGEALIASGPLHFAGRTEQPVVLGRDDAGGDSWAGSWSWAPTNPIAGDTVVRNTTGVGRDGRHRG
jgi:hypothetical protein